MDNSKRLAEVLKQAASVIEGLYRDLKRPPPSEGSALIEELRQFAQTIDISGKVS